jgi:hypothetical protein
VKLVTGLKAHGVDVEVVTVDPDSFYIPGGKSVDPSMLAIVPQGVKNHRIRSWEGNPLMIRLRENRLAHRLLYRIFEPRKREWTFPALSYLKKLDLSSYDAVLTCSQPHSNHLIGLALQRLSGKPWIAYLSDPWADMPWAEYPSQKIANYNLALERKVITSAAAVLFTSEETVDLVIKKYPAALRGKCGVLPHAYVPEWFSLVESPFPKGNDERLNILHTGHFYGERTPMPLFRALERLQAERGVADRMHFIFLGSMAEEHRRFVVDRGLDGLVTILETRPYLESLATMLRSDYLLIIDAPLQLLSESVFLPSKLVDYLGAGKPVIGITPAQGTAARVLRETGNLACDVADEEAVYRVFADLLDDRLSVRPETERVKTYHYLETSRQLAELIGTSVRERSHKSS